VGVSESSHFFWPASLAEDLPRPRRHQIAKWAADEDA